MTEYEQYFLLALSVDNVIFGFDDGDLKILLIKRAHPPFRNDWALPGGLVHPEENLDSAAVRVLEELTGLRDVFLEQVRAFGEVNRHPRGRVITVAYYSLIKINRFKINASSFAEEVKWHSISNLKDLAFDHKNIIRESFDQLKKNVRARPVGFELLPPKFTLTELQHLYESILETDLDKRNFRKKILAMDLLIDMKETQEGVAHRPAKLYRFDTKKYIEFVASGFNFEV